MPGAARLGIPVDPDAALKPPQAHRLLGRTFEAPRLAGLATGATRFVHDMTLPNMLHARVVRPPHYHARLVALDAGLDERLEGGHLVRDGSFLAVAHANEWTVTRLAAQVAAAARWSPERGLDAEDVFARLVDNPRISLPVVGGVALEAPVPPPAEPPANAMATLSARFQRPYQMHAAIGPSAALAHPTAIS